MGRDKKSNLKNRNGGAKEQASSYTWTLLLVLPLSIFVICSTGVNYCQEIGKTNGYNSSTVTAIKYVVIFGYFIGIIPAFLKEAIGQRTALLIASALALISFVGLGFVVEMKNQLGEILIFVFCFTAAVSGSIVTFISITLTVYTHKKFPVFCIAMLFCYWKIAPDIEFSIKNSLFKEIELKPYFIGKGIFLAILYGITAFQIYELPRSVCMNMFNDTDTAKYCLYYLLIQLLFIVSFYITCITNEYFLIGTILFIVTLVINFMLVILFRLKIREDSEASQRSLRLKMVLYCKDFNMILCSGEYLSLAFGSLLILGSTYAFNSNIFKMTFAIEQTDSSENLAHTFWIIDILGRFIGGLIFSILSVIQRPTDWLRNTCMISVLGFGAAFLANPLGSIFMYISCILVALSSGVLWIGIPSCIIEEIKDNFFELRLGFIFFFSSIGMVIFDVFFYFIYEWQARNDSGKCIGENCTFIQLIAFTVSALLATVLFSYAPQNKLTGEKRGVKWDEETVIQKDSGVGKNERKNKSLGKSKLESRSKSRNSEE